MRIDKDRIPAKTSPAQVRLPIRLLPEIDAALRRRISQSPRRHGEMVWQVAQALESFSLIDSSQVPNMRARMADVEPGAVRTTSIFLPAKTVAEMKRIGAVNKWSTNAIINGALAAWLGYPAARRSKRAS